MGKQYRVLEIKEGGLGTLLVGSSKLPVKRIEEELNRAGAAGWELDFMVVEQQRMCLFWTREGAIITMSKAT